MNITVLNYSFKSRYRHNIGISSASSDSSLTLPYILYRPNPASKLMKSFHLSIRNNNIIRFNSPKNALSYSQVNNMPGNLVEPKQGDTTTSLNDKNPLEYSDQKTQFGFSQVDKNTKATLVGKVFSTVATSYDLMNDAMSLGIHRLWKDQFINTLNPQLGQRFIDVAGGTGDIAFRIVKKLENSRCQQQQEHVISHNSTESPLDTINQKTYLIETINAPTNHQDSNYNGTFIHQRQIQSEVTVFDINSDMLLQGKKKEDRMKFKGLADLEWVQGDAHNIPYPDNSFDAYTIAFGIRNCTDIGKVLSEAYRVLKPGGRFMCLEFSSVRTPILSDFYDFYSFNVIPWLGKNIANDEASYKYLVESIRVFPDQEQFKFMIEQHQFKSVSYIDLTCGVAAIHSAFK